MDPEEKDIAAQQEETPAAAKRKGVNKLHFIVVGVCTVLIILLALLAYRLLSDIKTETETQRVSYTTIEVPPAPPPKR